ncbi:MAG: MBL fold metallo-hydrolase [Hyphomicrobiales bacterium]
MLRIGDCTIERIEETVLAEPSSIFVEWNAEIARENGAWLTPAYYDPAGDAFITSIHSWLVKTPRHTILIDCCGGNGKSRPLSPRFDHLDRPFLERLKAAGAEPGDVDIVINTHLHVDHVGWNTRLLDGQWVPTFANATYWLPRVEREFRDPKMGAAGKPPASHLIFLDSVQPILDSGKAKLVEGNEAVADGVDLMPIPGHAPGQMAVRLTAGGEEALFIADVMHQPIQIYYPHWNSRYCEDQELARRTRRQVLDYCVAHDSIILPGHFGAPHCGRVIRKGDGFAFAASATTP